MNSLPNEKILVWTKLKAFAEDKINLNEKLKLVLGRAENIVGKVENADYHLRQILDSSKLVRII